MFWIYDCLNAFHMWIVFGTNMVYMYFFWHVSYPTINITYRAAVQCVYFLIQVGITIICSLLNTVYYVCCVQIQVLHATCKILHYQQPILFVRNSSNIELKKEKHTSHNPWLLKQLCIEIKHRNHAAVEIRSMHEGNMAGIQNTGWGYVG